MEPVVKTSSFSIDRRSYAQAKLGFLLRRTALPFAIVIIICLLTLVELDDSMARILAFSGLGFIGVLELALVDITLTRIYARKYRHLVDAKRTIELSGAEVRVKAEGLGESNLSWKLFSGVETIGPWTFLMQDQSPAVVIPDSAFESEAELRTFRELVNRKQLEYKKRSK